MEEQSKSSVESWTLLALIYRDLDDGDYNNALFLSERLYAMNNQNPHYKFLYAKCLYNLLDYTACYTILKTVNSIPCLNLFAKSCLELGNIEESYDKQRSLWKEGTQALLVALGLDKSIQVYWGDELASITVRHHMPSKASLYNLLGDLYVKLDNISAACRYFWQCLKINPYKISAYTKLCDIAADCIDVATTNIRKEIFVDFDTSKTNLSRSPHSFLPAPPSVDESEIDFFVEITSSDTIANSFSVPAIKDYQDITVDQLRALVKFNPKVIDEDDESLDNEYQRGELEKKKDIIIETINTDIKLMKANEDYKNKHGLHKKPPVHVPHKLEVELPEIDENDNERNYAHDKQIYETIDRSKPPRVSRRGDGPTHPNKKQKVISGNNQAIDPYFLPQSNDVYTNQPTNEYILKGMNKVLQLLGIIANGYAHQSLYRCEKAALELQKLDDRQYNSARVLCILGKAYYDAGDHKTAYPFFRQAFVIAPWYCDGVPEYSTCLCYLEKEKELNLLAYKMRDNRSHLYESYIAAGNWAKCALGSNEASQWFRKAVKSDPKRSYAHSLLGHEELEKGNSLGAKQFFAKSITTNKRSYIGWCGMGLAYRDMDENIQAKTLLYEATRLNARHPVLLAKMAEVLYTLEEYKEALNFINKSLKIRLDDENEKLKELITLRLLEEE